MNKKKRSEKRKRNEIIQFRMTPEEKKDYLVKCQKAGLAGADYFRKTVLKSKPLRPMIDASLLIQLHASWGKIGSNINQIAKHYSSGNPTEQEIGLTLIEKVDAMRTELRQALGYDL